MAFGGFGRRFRGFGKLLYVKLRHEEQLQSPFATDWPWRFFVIPVAKCLEIPCLYLLKSNPHRFPKPITVAFAIVLTLHLPVLSALLAYGLVSSDLQHPGVLYWSNDYIGWIAVATIPMAIVAAYRFYVRLEPVLDSLHSEGTIKARDSDSYRAYKRDLLNAMNELRLQPVIIAITVLFGIGTLPWEPWIGYEIHWATLLPPAVEVWIYFFILMIVFSTLTFTWKCWVIWHKVRVLTTAGNVEFQIQERHPDTCGGLRAITDLWLHVPVVVASLGFAIFSATAVNEAWGEPISMFQIILYTALGPFLCLVPLFSIHNMMVKYRDRKVRTYANELDDCILKIQSEIRSAGSTGFQLNTLLGLEQFKRASYEHAKHLPTWPLSLSIWQKFVAIYFAPLLIPILDIVNRVT
ncbi:hypothetical protein ACFLVS_06670 [Chloroflexota bacterium]